VFTKQMLYHLSHTSSPFCSSYFGDGGLKNYLPQLASNCNSPNLSLPSEPLAPGSKMSLWGLKFQLLTPPNLSLPPCSRGRNEEKSFFAPFSHQRPSSELEAPDDLRWPFSDLAPETSGSAPRLCCPYLAHTGQQLKA
jgi:hypothetical protein